MTDGMRIPAIYLHSPREFSYSVTGSSPALNEAVAFKNDGDGRTRTCNLRHPMQKKNCCMSLTRLVFNDALSS